MFNFKCQNGKFSDISTLTTVLDQNVIQSAPEPKKNVLRSDSMQQPNPRIERDANQVAETSSALLSTLTADTDYPL